MVDGWSLILLFPRSQQCFLLPPDELEAVRVGRDRLSSVASVSIEEQVEFLEEKLSVLQSSQNVPGASRRAREKALRRELSNLRRQLRLERKAMESGGP